MYLGIDIGTSAVKLLLVDMTGAPVASASSELDILRPQSGFSEQDPEWWWQAVNKAAGELRGTYPNYMAAIRSIGLSGQMHGMVTLNKDDQVLRPAILWNDNAIKVALFFHYVFLGIFTIIGLLNEFSIMFYFFVLLLVAFVFIKIGYIKKKKYLEAFKFNNWVGIICVLALSSEIIW